MLSMPTNSGIGATWPPDMEPDCDCLSSPPPEFRLPPPPTPPFLTTHLSNRVADDCLDSGSLGDVGTCAAVPLVDPEYRSSPALPSIAVIVVCSILLLAMLLIASVLIWKHKRKVQNFLPCKTSPQSRCDGVAAANGIIYEDLTNMRPRTLAPSGVNPGGGPIELIDVKSVSAKYASGPSFAGGHHHYHPSVFICPPPPPPRSQEHLYLCNHSSAFPMQRGSVAGPTDVPSHQDLYNPVYEELSNGSERGDGGQDSDRDSDPGDQVCVQGDPGVEDRRNRRSNGSEDEFAEDELSAGEFEAAPSASSSTPLESSCSDPDCCIGRREPFLGSTHLPHGSRGPGPPRQGLATTVRRPRRHTPGGRSSERRPRSLDRRRGWKGEVQQAPPRQPLLFPSSSSSTASSASSPYCPAPLPQQQRFPSQGEGGVAHRLALLASFLPPLPLISPSQQIPNDVSPYETVSVVGLASGRGGINRPQDFSRSGKGSSQDSFGSDSGFSNNTSGGKRGPHNRHSGGSRGSGGSGVATELTSPFYGPGAPVIT